MKLLGGHISEDLKWKEHILTNESSVIKQLTSRVNGLCLISTRATFNTRLMVANGIVISRLCYLIQLWGGCEGYLLNSLQIIMNRAARSVTGYNCFTSTRRLLSTCNWLSVRQLVFYQTVIMTHKTMLTGTPKFMKQKFSTNYPYRTRQATTGSIRYGETFNTKSSLIQKSFAHRGLKDYNMIPSSIRASPTVSTFKTKLKKWVIANVNIS